MLVEVVRRLIAAKKLTREAIRNRKQDDKKEPLNQRKPEKNNSNETEKDSKERTSTHQEVKPKFANRGSSTDDHKPLKDRTSVAKPRNLNEKLALEAAKADYKNAIPTRTNMKDKRWPAHEGWRKYSYVFRGKYGVTIDVHFVWGSKLNLIDDFKIKLP